jgi:hypothetical protein
MRRSASSLVGTEERQRCDQPIEILSYDGTTETSQEEAILTIQIHGN